MGEPRPSDELVSAVVPAIISAIVGKIADALLSGVGTTGIVACAVCGAIFGFAGYRFGFFRGKSSDCQEPQRPARRKPSVAAACAGLSERSRAIVLEALDNGSVLVWWPGNTDAVHLVDVGLLEAPTSFSTAFPVELTVPARARKRLERDRSKLLGDIPPSRRKKLIG